MSAPSRRSFADWEKAAAKACIYCGHRILNKDASGTRYDHATGTGIAWHVDCGTRR